MNVTAWNNGSSRISGAGYGIKISINDRNQFFNRNWTQVNITINGTTHIINLTSSFWRNCRELRSKHIGFYIINIYNWHWPNRKPPILKLIHTNNNNFTLIYKLKIK